MSSYVENQRNIYQQLLLGHNIVIRDSVPSPIAVIRDRIYPAIGENCKVGITVNGSSNVCFSSPLKTLFLRGTFWGYF